MISIPLTPPGKKKVKVEGKLMDVRVIELACIDRLLAMSAQLVPTPHETVKLMEAREHALSVLPEPISTFAIDDWMVNYLSLAYTRTAGSRPIAWLYCRDLLMILDAIFNPEEKNDSNKR